MGILLGRSVTADIDADSGDEFWLTLRADVTGEVDVIFLSKDECVTLVALLAQHGVRADSAATAEVKAFCEQLEKNK